MQLRKLGLPFGTAVVSLAVVQMANSLYEIYMDIGFTYAANYWEGYDGKEYIIIVHAVHTLQAFVDLTCLWIGTVILGNYYALMVWIFISSLTVIHLPIVFFVFIYTHSLSAVSFEDLYSAIIYTSWYIYAIAIAIQTAGLLRQKMLEEIYPIGTGLIRIWKYFATNVSMTVRLLLTVEVIFNFYVFIFWKSFYVIFGNNNVDLEGDNVVFYFTEEYGVRGLRLAMALVGIWFIRMKKERWIKIWCAVSGLMLFTSLGIFLYLIVEWNASNLWFTYGYLTIFAISLGFRFFTIFAGLNMKQNDFINI